MVQLYNTATENTGLKNGVGFQSLSFTLLSMIIITIYFLSFECNVPPVFKKVALGAQVHSKLS